MPVAVSVVIATYNTGETLERTVDSVRRQSIGTDRLELVLVDDGSTDGTGERVLAMAEEEPWITAEVIENSGWPSRPRNVGMARATGDYVMVMDHDDLLFPRSLERMWQEGTRTRADMVLGKEVRSSGRTQGLETFRHNSDDARLVEDDVLLLHTPHRMWRREFLDRTGVRFSETLRRLEDHKIIAESMEHEPRICVVADEPCYQWVIHDDNSSTRLPDPVDYYRAFREVLDSVDRWPHPEDVVDHARAMWLRTTVLDRFGAGGALVWPETYRRAMFAEARAVTVERLPERLDARLPPLYRVRAELLRRGDLPALLDYVAVDGTVTTSPELTSHRLIDGQLELVVETALSGREGPVRFRREGDRVIQDATGPLDPDVADHALDVTDDLAHASVEVLLTHRSTHAEWFLPTEATCDLVADGGSLVLRIRATALLDPDTALLGRPLHQGVWDLRLRSALLGYDSRATIRVGQDSVPSAWDRRALSLRPYRTVSGRLAIKAVRRSAPRPAAPAPTISARVGRRLRALARRPRAASE